MRHAGAGHDPVCGKCAGNHHGKHPRTYGPHSVTIPVFQYLRQGFGENRVECTNSLASAYASPACPSASCVFVLQETRAWVAFMRDSLVRCKLCLPHLSLLAVTSISGLSMAFWPIAITLA